MPTKMYNVEKIRAELLKLRKPCLVWKGKELVEQLASPKVFDHGDGVLKISAEEGDGWADYYNEYGGGYPKIHGTLEQFARERGLFWEWQNAAVIALYK